VTTENHHVSFFADVMKLDDIPDVMAIEKSAFPIPWPEQAYRHEILENPNGYFVVARAQLPGAPAHDRNNDSLGRSLIDRLVGRPATVTRKVVGFAGLWMLVDEGHVSTIASHTDWRGHGVGELLLVTLLREAQRRKAIFATLEVRVSNSIAQRLYLKYGFTEVGRRRRYYQDNGEDALIMTVNNFTQPEYQTQLNALEQQLRARIGN
jgi:ribosomal-protein-alanine N-acetyltransferase